MNVKFLNPFVEAAHEVLRIETKISLQRGELSLEKTAYMTDDVTVILSLIGAVEGTVFYSMDSKTALNLASIIMAEELKNLDNLAQSGIAELGNVITGRASVKLADAGFEVTISPPALLLGRGATISTLDFPRLTVPLTGECGRITIHLALRENPNRFQKTPQIPVPPAPTLG